MKDFKINIFGTEYSVKFKDEVEFEEADFTWGASDAVDKEIEIAKRLPKGEPINKEEITRTLLHEVLHMILDEGAYFEESKSEPLVEWLTKCLYDLIVKQKMLDKIK